MVTVYCSRECGRSRGNVSSIHQQFVDPKLERLTKAEELLTQAGSLRHNVAYGRVDTLELGYEFAAAQVFY